MTVSPISASEMERRWSLARSVMADHGYDALIMHGREDWMGGYVRWFTDIPALNGYPRTVIFFADAPMVSVEMGAFGTDRAGIEYERGVGRVLGTPSFHSVNYTIDNDTALIVQALNDHGAKRIGILCPAAFPFGMGVALQSGFDCEDASDVLDGVKAIKSAEEQQLIAQIAKLQDSVFEAVLDFAAPGKTDRQIMSHAEWVGRSLGSDQGIYLGMSAPMGTPSRFMGRHFQDRTISRGDHLSILIEINGPGGLYLEIARTVTFGPASDALLEGFSLMRKAQDYSLSLMKPGALPSDIAAKHDAWMHAHGLPPETRLYAHGQGCEMVERPLIRADETMPLAENMCLAVHPGFDDGKQFSVICDNYIIGPEGPGDCLHKTAKKIFEL